MPAPDHPSPSSRLRRFARRVPGAQPLAALLRRWLVPYHREIHRLRTAEAGRVFQPFPTTSEDRYPRLFDALAERLAGIAEPRILSFGCASGEEVRALRRRMPHARIVGIDLNRQAIAAARQADPNPLSEYRLAGAPEEGDSFDAVLALAVFRHGDLERLRPQNCAAILPFARFEQGLEALDKVLKPGGWLALFNQHFVFGETALAERYTLDPFRVGEDEAMTLLYGRDDERVLGAPDASMLFHKKV